MTYGTETTLCFIHILHVRPAARGLRKNSEIPGATDEYASRKVSFVCKCDVVRGTKAHLRQRGALVDDVRHIIVLRAERSRCRVSSA